ncbi:hypothetical protein [Candidiatus Paracoxiella cheracis]|uniref:hypothetical protein n=1 Tax=Candidiatus Paracoxiella cheracis TaxID=3405120 RepID=UPI003BF575E8
MQHRVYTEEELDDLKRKLEEGPATFLVKEVSEEVSGAGNEMFKLKLEVTDATGAVGFVTDYLVPDSRVAYKLKHFWDAVGEPEVYERGETYAANYDNKKGHCELEWQKSKNPNYKDRIGIKDYIAADAATAVDAKPAATATQSVGPAPAPSDEGMNDDIPF